MRGIIANGDETGKSSKTESRVSGTLEIDLLLFHALPCYLTVN
jgi:hypothetical protein